jgi:hypothetical protein
MSFCEKFILKDVQDFQKLTAEEKKNHLALYKHQYLAWGFAHLFLESMIPQLIVFICIVNLMIYICVGGIPAYILFFASLPFATAILGIDVIIIYRYERKKETQKEVWEYLTKMFQNLWLLNCQVISFKDWKTIKKRCKWYNYRTKCSW